MNKIKYYLMYLFPILYWVKHESPDGKIRFAIWRQWLGKKLNYCEFEFETSSSTFNAMTEYIKTNRKN